MHRDVAAHRPGVLTRVGLATFVDPRFQGCAMNDLAAATPIVARVSFNGQNWLHFANIAPMSASCAPPQGPSVAIWQMSTKARILAALITRLPPGCMAGW